MDYSKKRKARKNYTQVEDTLLVQALHACRREWKSVLSFMRRHAEVLGEAGDQYLEEGNSDKALHERLRKRATKLLNQTLPSRNTNDKGTSSRVIDDEYASASSEEETKDAEEVEEICRAINARETKYVFDAEGKESLKDPTEVLTRIKRVRESEREEDRERPLKREAMSKSSKKLKSSRNSVAREKKLDSILEDIPSVLEAAQSAAQEHKEALKSWRAIHGLDPADSSSDEN